MGCWMNNECSWICEQTTFYGIITSYIDDIYMKISIEGEAVK